MLNQDTQVEQTPTKQQQQLQAQPQQSEPKAEPEPELQLNSKQEDQRPQEEKDYEEKSQAKSKQQQQQNLLNQQNNNININISSNSYNKHNPLNDHDYCSPNKRLTSKQQQQNKSNKSTHLQLNSSSKLPALESVASTSSSPNRKNINRNSSDLLDHEHRSSSSGPPSPSSSSSSSSLSSSVASSKELIIAQDSSTSNKLHHGSRNLKIPVAPKDTPSVLKKRAHKVASKAPMDDDGSNLSVVRAKRARQTTSVTDKSEWITGDDQIDSALSDHLVEDQPKEKRQRIQKEQDSEFTQLSSSDYSSSGEESEQESDNSEDDPNRLWCICQKPHGGKFMICCDVCKDWFHGHCVGVTKLMGDRFEKQGKEWFCGECHEKLRAGIPRNAILKKREEKEQKKKKKNPISGKRGRGRPRKSETLSREMTTRSSQRTTRKSSSSLDPKMGVDNGRLRKNLARSDARSESFDEFEDSQRLRELIKERKKEFFYKRHLAEQRKAARRNELGLGRQSLTANLSDSLDSLATNTSTPNMSNLPTNIKSEHKERPKPNIVLQINTKKDSSSDQANSSSRIVTAIVRSPKKNKHAEASDSFVDDLFTAEPIQINKKVKSNTTISANTAHTSGDTPSLNGDASFRKRSSSGSSTSKNDNKSPTIEPGETSTPKKKRKSSESGAPNGSYLTGGGSKHAQIAQKIKDSLEARSKQIKDLEVSSDKIEKLANEIEGQLSECFKDTQKYLNKFRSLIFNLGDPKNQGLVKNVLTGEIAPARLVRMSPDEMASHELAKWRERENKHSIELIKRDALLAQQVIVKKTHKGEEVISAPSVNEPDDPSAVVDNQEPPTTPTKPPVKETRSDGSKITLTPSPTSSVSKPSGPLKMKITGITSDSSIRTTNQDRATAPTDSKIPAEDSLPFLDTTKDHKNHVFDMNCKICTKQTTEEAFFGANANAKAKDEAKNKTPESEFQPDQPKRLRISIDTKLDPSNLSRLREPLVKPILPPTTIEESYSPSKALPEPLVVEDNEDEPYDPEIGPAYTEPTSNEPCWSGTITMPDIAKFSASAKPVSGIVNFMREELSENLMVCGRISPDHVQGYIKKLKSTPKNQILIIQLIPLTQEDKGDFETFFDYLYSRNRYGVISTSPQVLKDFYILPIHENRNIPDFLKPIKGPGLDRKECSNCLIGLLVRGKKPTTSTKMTSSYTPTPIK